MHDGGPPVDPLDPVSPVDPVSVSSVATEVASVSASVVDASVVVVSVAVAELDPVSTGGGELSSPHPLTATAIPKPASQDRIIVLDRFPLRPDAAREPRQDSPARRSDARVSPVAALAISIPRHDAGSGTRGTRKRAMRVRLPRAMGYLARNVSVLVWILLAAISLPPTWAHAAPATAVLPVDATLAERIDAAFDSRPLSDATIGVHVLDLHSGATLYAREADKPLNPASNMKLLTTAAALHRLGPEYRYPTRLLARDGGLSGSTVQGDLYLVGSGDPSLTTEDLDKLAAELHALGIRRITGGIVVDASRFDRDELPPGFDQKEELASYRAPSGAVSINYNTFVVRAQPGAKIGDPALAGIEPDVAGILLTNEAKTVAGRGRKLFADVEYKDAIRVRFHGEIGIEASADAYRYPIAKPTRYAGEVLALVLKRHGIRLGKQTIKSGTLPPKAKPLATHFSPPIAVLIRAVNKLSNNFMAEQILKTLADPGSPASFSRALDGLRAALGELGVESRGARLGNGSGLYDTNRVTPAQLTALLRAMHRDFRYGTDYLSSLSVMGVDGTTRSRLRDTPTQRWVRVKTGTLDGVSALSGYVGGPDRAPIVFSILVNDLPRAATGSVRAAQDEVVDLLARYAAGRPLVDP
jgi:serine-type D-Ala-D-Ala carboxypeptidase/endopeptidase (penicillin-binding protein 4)